MTTENCPHWRPCYADELTRLRAENERLRRHILTACDQTLTMCMGCGQGVPPGETCMRCEATALRNELERIKNEESEARDAD
jgi:hypothetical protein